MEYICPHTGNACPILSKVMVSHKDNPKAQTLAAECLRCKYCNHKIKHDLRNLPGTRLGKHERELLNNCRKEIEVTSGDMSKSLNVARRRAAAKLEKCGLVSIDYYCWDDIGSQIKRLLIQRTMLGRFVAFEFQDELLTGKPIRWKFRKGAIDLEYWDDEQMTKDWYPLYRCHLRYMKTELKNWEMIGCDLVVLRELEEDIQLFSEIIGPQSKVIPISKPAA